MLNHLRQTAAVTEPRGRSPRAAKARDWFGTTGGIAVPLNLIASLVNHTHRQLVQTQSGSGSQRLIPQLLYG